MTAKSNRRGHEIIWRDGFWQYSDIDEIANYDRPCTRCGKMPLPHGYDACLGYIAGVKHACCGHGVENPFFIQDDDSSTTSYQFIQGGDDTEENLVAACPRCNYSKGGKTPEQANMKLIGS